MRIQLDIRPAIGWFLLLACVQFFSLTALYAGTTGKIAGIVKDGSGEVIPGANIVIQTQIVNGKEVAMTPPAGASTDADGTYFIINLRPGLYVVECSFIGYQTTVKKPISVAVDRTTNVNFSMSEEVVEGETVVVVAEKEMIVKDLTSASAKVSGETISELPVESFEEVLTLQAGITTGLDGSLHIRGGRSSEIKYYVDGIAISNPFNNGLAVPVENNAIQELEVISGTFNAEYGQAQSGIINIVTKDGTDELTGSFSAYTGDFISSNDDIFWNIDDVNLSAQQYYEGSLSGPLLTSKLKFFASGRFTDHENWLYGQRVFEPIDSSSFVETNPDNWYIEQTGDGQFVSMNPTQSFSGQVKLTYQLIPSVKLSYTFMANEAESKNFSPRFRLNPDSRRSNFSNSVNHLFNLTHTVSPSVFYTLKLTQYNNNLDSYVHEDVNNPEYQALFGRDRQPGNVFSTGGIDGFQSFQESQTYAVRADINMQVNRANFVKLGVEYRGHNLKLEDYTIDVDPLLYGDSNSRIPPLTSTEHNQYEREPIEFSAYIQDKIEIDDLIVNAGLRFDYFDPQSVVPTDLRDPSNKLFPVAESEAYASVDPKTQLSPRIGLAFPITARGVIHAAYGNFFQIPEFSRLYQNPEFEVVGFYSSLIGNADLEAQRTDMYEIGLQQQLTNFMSVDLTGYYRNVRNLLGSELFQTYRTDILYGRYANNSHGSVRGFTLAAKFRVPDAGVTADLNYTYQTAKGVASDPRQAFFDAGGRNEATIVLNPLDWDLRHTFNAYVVYSRNSWVGSVIVNMNSGYPFTPGGFVELRNNGRYQGDLNIDLSATRRLSLGNALRVELFGRIENLLDRTRNDFLPEIRPLDNEAHISNGFNRINSLYEFNLNPARQPVPREIRFGARIVF